LTEAQKQFLEDKYNRGEQQKMKFNANDVAREMETLMNGNEYVFEPYQWLKPSQIQSFWSRLTKNRRRSSQKKATSNETTTPIDDIDNPEEEEEEDDELFEEVAGDIKRNLLKKKEQINQKTTKDSSGTDNSPTLSKKTKQSQRSMDNLAEQQLKKRSVHK